MSVKPLPPELRDRLRAFLQGRSIQAIAKAWGIDRMTLSDAATGYAKRASMRFLIEIKLEEEESKANPAKPP